MKLITRCAAAALVALPAIFAVLPAQALQATQYKAQGHGRYLNSSGTPVRSGYGHWRRPWHRWHHYRHYRHYR